jgi:hypothetical protein
MICTQCGQTVREPVHGFELRGPGREGSVHAVFCTLGCLTVYALECLVDALADPALSRNGTR